MVPIISEATYPGCVYIIVCLMTVIYKLVFARVRYKVLILYTKPIGIIAKKYGVQYHLYADDTQLYVSLDLGNNDKFSSSLENLKHCIEEIRLWMTQNMLKLNDDKTDIIYMASPHCAKSLLTPGLDIGESCINPSSTVRNLGVLFDKYLTMNDHVTAVCKAAYYRQAGFRKGYGTVDQVFVLSGIISHLLNCNRKLYCAFVDFRRAFDSLNHKCLWFKLIKCGIRGKLYKLIYSLYQHVKVKVRCFDGSITNVISCMLGLCKEKVYLISCSLYI